MKFQLHCDAEDRISLHIEGQEMAHEFRTLLSALTFAHEIVGKKEVSLTVIDSKGQIVEEAMIGPGW